MDIADFLIRIGVGTGLAAFLGLEREVTGKSAGLRTHALVGLGAALFTVISSVGFGAGDPSRVAAQIVSGIGFLGAGAIFRSGALIKGLTTAAGLWAAAAVGMTSGAGELAFSTLATLIAALVLTALRWLDPLIGRLRRGTILEVTVDPAGQFMSVRESLEYLDPRFEVTDFHNAGDGTAVMTLIVSTERAEMLRNSLEAMDPVRSARKVS